MNRELTNSECGMVLAILLTGVRGHRMVHDRRAVAMTDDLRPPTQPIPTAVGAVPALRVAVSNLAAQVEVLTVLVETLINE